MKKETPCPLKHIKDKAGIILTCEEEIIQRWKEHFVDLLNGEQREAEEEEVTLEMTRNQEEEEEAQEHITDMELQKSIKKLRNGKAAGHDMIYPEMLKSMGPLASNVFLDILNGAWTSKTIPEDWGIAVVVSTPHKSQYHSLTVSHKSHKSYTMYIIASDTMIGKAFHAGFIDLSPAFDRKPRCDIWKALVKLCEECELTQGIKSLYNNCRNYVRISNNKSSECITKQGVRRGDNLSLLLFILLLDQLMKEVKERARNLVVGNYQLRAEKICSLAFADDIVVLGKN